MCGCGDGDSVRVAIGRIAAHESKKNLKIKNLTLISKSVLQVWTQHFCIKAISRAYALEREEDASVCPENINKKPNAKKEDSTSTTDDVQIRKHQVPQQKNLNISHFTTILLNLVKHIIDFWGPAAGPAQESKKGHRRWPGLDYYFQISQN